MSHDCFATYSVCVRDSYVFSRTAAYAFARAERSVASGELDIYIGTRVPCRKGGFYDSLYLPLEFVERFSQGPMKPRCNLSVNRHAWSKELSARQTGCPIAIGITAFLFTWKLKEKSPRPFNVTRERKATFAVRLIGNRNRRR